MRKNLEANIKYAIDKSDQIALVDQNFCISKPKHI